MANPMTGAFNKTFAVEGEPMTIAGAVNKTLLLLLIAVASAAYTWYLTATGMADKANMFAWLGIIGGFICVMIAAFKPQHSKILSISYAFLEGLVLGSISAVFQSVYNGIVVQAVLATFITLFVMLTLYKTGIIKASPTLRKVLMISMFSILIFYLLVILTSFLNIGFLAPLVAAYNNPIVIGAIIIIAALMLILDFDFVERGAQQYFPKYFEWYGAMSTMVTLVWLYLEFLRLFASSRNR